MKKNFINILIVGFIVVLLFLFFYNFNEFTTNRNELKLLEQNNIQFCLDNDYVGQEYEEFCKSVLNEKKYEIDFFTTFSETFVLTFNSLIYFLFIILAVPTLLFVCKYFKNKVILSDLSRENYKSIKRKILKNSYKSIIIIPIIVLVAFVVCFNYTNNFDPTYAIVNSSTIWEKTTLNSPYLFIILYIINVFIHSILYINISLCIARKQHSFFPALILSFLCFIGIESILEILFGGIICTSILDVNCGILFNIMNMFAFNDCCGILSPLIVPSIMLLISFLVLFIVYSNKESLIIDIEKNERKE